MSMAAAEAEDIAAIKAWFDEWGREVAARRFEEARERFHPEVIGFGTWMDFVDGLDALEQHQWRSIWPTIEDFEHRTEGLRCLVSPDRLMAVGMTVWTSTGFHGDGTGYDRPGRTTAVFVRGRTDRPWSCIHTHVSLFRGVPQQSHGGTAPSD